jgi:hypothetical protein
MKAEKFLTLNVDYLLKQNSLNTRKQYIAYTGFWLEPEEIFLTTAFHCIQLIAVHSDD